MAVGGGSYPRLLPVYRRLPPAGYRRLPRAKFVILPTMNIFWPRVAKIIIIFGHYFGHVDTCTPWTPGGRRVGAGWTPRGRVLATFWPRGRLGSTRCQFYAERPKIIILPTFWQPLCFTAAGECDGQTGGKKYFGHVFGHAPLRFW